MAAEGGGRAAAGKREEAARGGHGRQRRRETLGAFQGTPARPPAAEPRWALAPQGRAPGSACARRPARALRTGSARAGAAGFVFPFLSVQVTFPGVRLVQACPERAGLMVPACCGSAGDTGETMIPRLQCVSAVSVRVDESRLQ